MAQQWLKQHSLSGGAVSTELYDRDDLERFYSSVASMVNMIPQPTGAAVKRPGKRMVAEIPEAAAGARLAEFVFSNTQRYLFAVLDGATRIFRDDVAEADIVTPWTAAHLTDLNWVQRADTFLGFHRDVKYQRIQRQGADDTWDVADLAVLRRPGYHFGYTTKGTADIDTDSYRTLADGDPDGETTITSSANDFANAKTGWLIQINGGLCRILAVNSATQVYVQIIQSMTDPSDAGPGQWWLLEVQWSDDRGWPAGAVFHKNRLCLFGGSRPTSVALSTARDVFDFDAGAGEDDDAVIFELLGQSMDDIFQAVSANDNLVFLTSAGEWVLTTDVVTPSTPGATSFSAFGAANVRPVLLDSGVIFVGNPETGQNQILEVAWTDNALSTLTEVVSLLAPHLIDAPTTLVGRRGDGRRSANHVFAVNANGTVALLVSLKKQGVTGWSQLITAGDVLDAAVLGPSAYFLVRRTIDGDTRFFLEVMDNDHALDCSRRVVNPAPATVHDGFDHLEGHTVAVVADGLVEQSQVVVGGQVATSFPATVVEAGLPFEWEISTLPMPSAVLRGKTFQKARIAAVEVALDDAVGVKVNDRRVVSRAFGDGVLDAPPPRASGTHEVKLLGGWDPAPSARIHGDEPGPVTVRAFKMKVEY